MKTGQEYWESLSYDDRNQILQEGNLFNGFAKYLWEYLPTVAQEYIEFRLKEKNNYEG